MKAISLKEVYDIATTRLQRLISWLELVYLKQICSVLMGLLGILNAVGTL